MSEPQTTSPSNLFWDLGFQLCLKPFLLVYSNRLVIFGVLQGVTSQFEQRDPVHWLKFFTGNTLTSQGAGSTGEWNHQRHNPCSFSRKRSCSNCIPVCSSVLMVFLQDVTGSKIAILDCVAQKSHFCDRIPVLDSKEKTHIIGFAP